MKKKQETKNPESIMECTNITTIMRERENSATMSLR